MREPGKIKGEETGRSSASESLEVMPLVERATEEERRKKRLGLGGIE